MNRIERLSGASARIGGDAPPSNESIRFAHDTSLAFRSGDVSRVMVGRIPAPPGAPESEARLGFRVQTTFLGLSGVVSPLPTTMAEEVLLDDTQIRGAFLDLFHHRLVSLFYRSTVRFSPAREHRSDGADPWMSRALGLAGLDVDGGALSDLPPHVKLRLLPILARRARGARSFQRALSVGLGSFLGIEAIPVELREWKGSTSNVPAHCSARLSNGAPRLGEGALLGSAIRDPGGMLEVIVGPLKGREKDAFIRDGRGLAVVGALLDAFGRRALRARIKVLATPDAIDPLRLGVGRGRLLGVDAFLGTRGDEILALQTDLEVARSPRR